MSVDTRIDSEFVKRVRVGREDSRSGRECLGEPTKMCL